MSDEFDDDAQPTFNNIDGTRSSETRRRRPPSNSSNVNVLPIGDKEEKQEIEQLLPPCRICHSKRVEYDKIIEGVICGNCGNIESASIESLIAEQRQLSSSTNPYTPVKPVFISLSSSSLSNYEDIHRPDKEVYKASSQEALRLEYEKFKRKQKETSWF